MLNQLNQINQSRRDCMLPTLESVWCYHCKKKNQHWPQQCPLRLCTICYGDHWRKDCRYLKACNWCGSLDHKSGECRNDMVMIRKAAKTRRCYGCGRIGHLAAECDRRFWHPLRRRAGFRNTRRTNLRNWRGRTKNFNGTRRRRRY